jgi:two-component system sensor histidine kinase AlgZ
LSLSKTQDSFFLPDLCKVGAVVFLVLLAELLALVLTLAVATETGFSWEFLALSSLFTQWVVLASAALLCVMRPFLARLSLPWASGCSYLLILLVAMLCSFAGQYLGLAADAGGLDWRRTAIHLLIAAILAGIALRYFYLQQQLRQQQEAELRARIEALQARIRPHFLFNSMNTIASLIASDPQLAERAVEDLADLFRQSLAAEQTQVPLHQEIELCRRFVAIESLRLGSRLQLVWDIDPLPDYLEIPRFTLQPLIENAIYHGIQPLPEGGRVDVKVAVEASRCRLQVKNPVVINGSSARSGHQMALQNITRRMQALYGNAASVEIERGSGSFCVTVSYPFQLAGRAAV